MELGEALRIGQKEFFDVPIHRRLTDGATPVFRKGAMALHHAALVTKKVKT
jgi:hypothetical protein